MATVAAAPVAAPTPVAPLRVGLLGLGTVGAGTWAVLQRNAALIAARAGRAIEVRGVAVRNLERARARLGSGADQLLTDDPHALVTQADIDVVVEVMGGTGLARTLVLQAMAQGKHVVTANKALLAEHGAELFAAAQAHGVVLAYEGAVAVSIPIIKALREGLSANRIEWVAGIINGTTNYILSAMQEQGADYAPMLAEAQRLGYAEADPALDVQGMDAAHKLALLAANAFGTPVQFAQVQVQGITALQALDLGFAAQLGYRAKLLGVARRHGDALELRVQPVLLRASELLAQVDGAMNAVVVKSDAAGTTLYYGAGAGSEQTGSAVVADLVDLARLHPAGLAGRVPALGFHGPRAALPVLDSADVGAPHYLRLDLDADHAERTVPAVLQQLALDGVRVQRMLVLPHPQHSAVQCLVALTEPVPPRALQQAVHALESWPGVLGYGSVLRVEELG
ncbi:MAG: homoserine dehydrogenase [Rhodoferax sp.]